MANVLDYVESEFELQFTFGLIPLGKLWILLKSNFFSWIVTRLFFFMNIFDIE